MGLGKIYNGEYGDVQRTGGEDGRRAGRGIHTVGCFDKRRGFERASLHLRKRAHSHFLDDMSQNGFHIPSNEGAFLLDKRWCGQASRRRFVLSFYPENDLFETCWPREIWMFLLSSVKFAGGSISQVEALHAEGLSCLESDGILNRVPRLPLPMPPEKALF